MVLFQLPYRTFFINGIESPALTGATRFDIRLTAKLAPDEYFGSAPLTGRLRIFPPNCNLHFNGTFFGGIRRMKTPEGTTLQKFRYSERTSWAVFSMEGSVATIEFAVDKQEIIGGIVQRIIEFLPASFAAVSTCAVSVVSMDGTVNGVPFDVRFTGNAPGGESFSVNEINPEVAEYLNVVLPMLLDMPRKIISAHRYLAQSFLLEAASEFSYEFTGERLLNLCKALEALVPNEITNDVDGIRKYLRGWGLNKTEAEIFASLKYLRNELDSAHIASSPITEESHRAVARFVNVAERAVQALVVTAVKKYAADKSLFPATPVKTTQPGAIKHLAKYADLVIPSDWAGS
jgi:hypothetical protein